MASTVLLCNRISSKCGRIKLDGIDLSGQVVDLKNKTSLAIEIPAKEIELLYCGKVLQDDQALEGYGIKAGVTVYALKKREVEQQDDPKETINPGSRHQLVTALQSALMNPAYRNTVEKMLTNPETVENIVTATPGLEKDPVALTMLRDPELLAILADPKNINKVMEAHPCLAQAATIVAAAVNEEVAKGGLTSSATDRPGLYSLDQMSDDDDLEAVQPRAAGGAGHMITSEQLAAALASAAGQPTASTSSPSTSGSSSSGGGSGGGLITSDLLQQAMAQAAAQTMGTHGQAQEAVTEVGGLEFSGGGSGGGLITSDLLQQAMAQAAAQTMGTHGQAQEAVTEQQMQQMRDMGISDEATARRALEATGGDIHAALELIFGDGNF